MREISKNQYNKIIRELVGRTPDSFTGGITKIQLKAGKCAQIDDKYYADDKALKLIGVATARKKRRVY